MNVNGRLRTFMKAHRLNGKQMAKILQTPYNTFEKWKRSEETTPPGCLLTLMTILEQSSDVRKSLGIFE